MSKKILFLSPETFSGIGGIQRMTANMVYLLYDLCKKKDWNINLYCLNDHSADLTPQYLPSSCFKGFGKNKARFLMESVRKGMNADIVILAHVNLSIAGILIRILNPGCEIWLIAHGIEVWSPMRRWRKLIWKMADKFICVSSFTKNQVVAHHQPNPKRCVVLNNCLDPFIKLPEKFRKPDYLLERYDLKGTEKVILTLTRMSATEKFKGYDNVISALARISTDASDIRYLLAGPCDAEEKSRIETLILRYKLGGNIILTGYIEETELTDHYLLADLFVLPSHKEGFGIVFIEAMACGLPVICGNIDGSTDAVRHKGMGIAVDPNDPEALELAIRKQLHQNLKPADRKNIQKECLKYFNGLRYAEVLSQLIQHEKID